MTNRETATCYQDGVNVWRCQTCLRVCKHGREREQLHAEKGQQSMKPLVMRSDLSDPPRYYVVTRYREKEGVAVAGKNAGEKRRYIVAQTKYDVTEQVQGLIDSAVSKALSKAKKRSSGSRRDTPSKRRTDRE